MKLKSAKLAIIGSVILIISSTINPTFLGDKYLRSQTLITKVVGQEINIEWNQTYGGTEDDEAKALIQTSDGGFALAGYTKSYGPGYLDMWLVKTEVNGALSWDQTYGGIHNDYATALIQTSEGGFALGGWTYSYGAGLQDMWLVKTNVDGTVEWNHTYGGTDYDFANALIQTSDGGFALAGSSLLKTDADGKKEWNQTYGGTENDVAKALIQTSDGGFALAGWTVSYGAGLQDMWLVKTNADGEKEWDQTYGGTENDLADATALIQTSDGGFALAGWIYSSSSADMWLVKADADGEKEWDQTYGGTENDFANALIQTSDGGFAMAGTTGSFGVEVGDIWLVKTDVDGKNEWNLTHKKLGYEEANALIQTSDGGFALAGYAGGLYGGYLADMWLVKIGPIDDAKSDNGFLDSHILPGLMTMFVLTYSYRTKQKKSHIEMIIQ